MTEHRWITFLMWLIFIASTALAVWKVTHPYTFLSGMSFGVAFLATAICWRWKL